MTELKELYKEEVILAKRIQEFGKKKNNKVRSRARKSIMLLLYRIFTNLYIAIYVTAFSIKRDNIKITKLSLGLILRCTFIDCILALYLLNVDKKRAEEELNLKNIEYANSLLERKEIYRDQLKSISKDFNDTMIDNFWELTIEDNFLGDLTIEATEDDFKIVSKNKSKLKDEGFLNTKSKQIKEQYTYLCNFEEMQPIVEKLYQYYKYFSQYEHFSERSEGDILQDTAGDNIHLPSSIKALSNGVHAIVYLFEKGKKKKTNNIKQ